MNQLTQGDENFKQRLSRCTTVKGIFKLLDVPDEEVTPHSAAFALQKLCPLQKGMELYIFWLIQIEIGVGGTFPRLRKFTYIILCGSFYAATLAVEALWRRGNTFASNRYSLVSTLGCMWDVFHPSQPMPGGFPLEVFFHPQKGSKLFHLEPSHKANWPVQNLFWVT